MQKVRATRPHVSIVSYRSEKRSKLRCCCWFAHLQDGIDLFLPRFDAFWRHPMPKEISFLDAPFTLRWINFKPCLLQTLHHFFYHLHVFLVRAGKDSNVIN